MALRAIRDCLPLVEIDFATDRTSSVVRQTDCLFDELTAAIDDHVAAHNIEPKPFMVCETSALPPTPTNASWLNQVERWFGKITDQRIRRRASKCAAELEKAILDHVETNNGNPKPFVLTADADLILEKVEKLCTRINPSGHYIVRAVDRAGARCGMRNHRVVRAGGLARELIV